ncbi:hypothetical protein pdam_00013994, partial [Pocillopora damicornis]
MSVSHFQHQHKESVYTNGSRGQDRHCRQNRTYYPTNIVDTIQNIASDIFHTKRSVGYIHIEWLNNEPNAKVSDCKASKEEFRWKMNRQHLAKNALMERRIFRTKRNSTRPAGDDLRISRAMVMKKSFSEEFSIVLR